MVFDEVKFEDDLMRAAVAAAGAALDIEENSGRQLSVEELSALANPMVNARSARKKLALREKIIRGFYDRI